MNEFILIIIITIAAFFFSSQWVPQKKAVKLEKLEDPRLYNISMGIGIIIGCLIYFLIYGLIFQSSTYHWYPIIIAMLGGFLWQLANRFIIVSVNEIGMGQTTVFLNLIAVFSFLIGIFFFREILFWFDMVGFFFIIMGCMIISLINRGEDSKRSWKGISAVLIASFLISIFNALSLESMNSMFDFPSLTFYDSCLFVAIGIVIGNFVLNLKPSPIKKWWNLGHIHKFAILGGLSWSSGILLISFVLVLGGLGFGISIVQAIILIFGALWGILYFKEIIDKNKLLIFLIGAIIVALGIIFLSI
ncbi:MAG: hypothetical protein EAX96_07865 [Candidatus Lokiarchaeota archaeon]|nr:hypothetical protein [Candidatus Lokiarchaeota archaeon]